jgi:hypothetical protein
MLLSASAMPMTAHSATSLWPLNTSSMPHDVDDVVGAAHHVDVVVVVLKPSSFGRQ